MPAGKRTLIYFGALAGISCLLALGFWMLTANFARVFVVEAIAATVLSLVFGWRFFCSFT